MALSGDLGRALDRIFMAGKETPHLVFRFEMALGIGMESETGTGNGAFFPDASQHIGKRSPARFVIMHVIEGDERRSALARKIGKTCETLLLIALIGMNGTEKDAARRGFGKGDETSTEDRVELLRRQSDQHLTGTGAADFGKTDMAFGLFGAPVAFRQKTAEPAIGFTVGRIGQHLEAVESNETHARKIFDLALAG